MKSKRMWRYIISWVCFFSMGYSHAQTIVASTTLQENETQQREPRTFALRAGIDLVKPLTTQFSDDYVGLEIVGDLQLSKRLYAAAEIGTEEKTQQAELINFTTSGSYFKIGIDYNFFNNWKGMNNALYLGARYARSLHTHTVNQYELYQLTQYLRQPPTNEGYATGEREQISNGWVELLVGTKVQLLPNFFAGISARLHILNRNPQPENFGNLYAPGFNKITDDNKFGASFNYTLTYSFPFRFGKKRKTTTQ